MAAKKKTAKTAPQHVVVGGTNTSTPEWLQKNIDNLQKAADAKAADALRVYEQNVAQWIVNNMHARDIGSPISPPPTIPMVETWYDAGMYAAVKMSPHPGAKPAVLPPPVPVNPDNPSFGGTGAAARDGEMFRLLYAILEAVSK